MKLRLRRLGLRRAAGRLWHHFFRDSTLSPHQAFKGPTRSPSTAEIESFEMTDPVNPAQTSSAPTAAQAQTQTQPATDSSSQQNLPIRDANSTKPPAQQQQQRQGKPKPKGTDGSTPAAAGAGAGGDKQLTPAELKKQAKAEKAARRAKEKLEREQQGGAGAAGGSAPGGGQGRPPATPKKDAGGGGAPQKGQRAPPPRRGSGPVAQAAAAAEEKKKRDDKKVAVFGHLYGQQRRTTVAGAGKEVHPAVLALGLQLRDYVVCGSSARCVATLLAFKRVSLGRGMDFMSVSSMLTQDSVY